MIQQARSGAIVVRLKSGDPLVFGRAGEEIEALEQAQIPFEIVPGVTAMFAAAAATRKSLTDRRSASKVILTTAHHASSDSNGDRPALWRGPLPNDATLGIYMPGRDLRALAWDMLKAGSGGRSTLRSDEPGLAAGRSKSDHHTGRTGRIGARRCASTDLGRLAARRSGGWGNGRFCSGRVFSGRCKPGMIGLC